MDYDTDNNDLLLDDALYGCNDVQGDAECVGTYGQVPYVDYILIVDGGNSAFGRDGGWAGLWRILVARWMASKVR